MSKKKVSKANCAITHIVGQHQSSSLDDKLMGLLVSDNGGCQTRGTAGFAAGVHSSGTEFLDVPEKTNHRVYTANITSNQKGAAMGIKTTASLTHLRNWLLAVLGSPTMQTLISPLSEVLSMVVLGTPPNSISRTPRFTSSFPVRDLKTVFTRLTNKGDKAEGIFQRGVMYQPWIVGKRLVHRLW